MDVFTVYHFRLYLNIKVCQAELVVALSALPWNRPVYGTIPTLKILLYNPRIYSGRNRRLSPDWMTC